MKITAILSLLALFALPIASGEEKTYGGRTFDDWKALAANDLETQTREQAVRAIGVLGHHGHEAAAIEVLRRAIASERDAGVVQRAYIAILTYGDDATATIEAGLGAESDGTRRIALQALSEFFLPGRGAIINTRFETLPTRITPQLLSLLEDSEVDVRDRVAAVKTIQGLLSDRDPGEELAKQLLPARLRIADSADLQLATEALNTIGRLGERAVIAIPVLVSFAEKEEPPRRSRDRQTLVSRQLAAIHALNYLGPAAKDAIPTLEKLQGNDSRRASMVAASARRALESIRSEPKND